MDYICPRRNKQPKKEESERDYQEDLDQEIEEELDLSAVEKFSPEDLDKFLVRDQPHALTLDFSYFTGDRRRARQLELLDFGAEVECPEKIRQLELKLVNSRLGRKFLEGVIARIRQLELNNLKLIVSLQENRRGKEQNFLGQLCTTSKTLKILQLFFQGSVFNDELFFERLLSQVSSLESLEELVLAFRFPIKDASTRLYLSLGSPVLCQTQRIRRLELLLMNQENERGASSLALFFGQLQNLQHLEHLKLQLTASRLDEKNMGTLFRSLNEVRTLRSLVMEFRGTRGSNFTDQETKLDIGPTSTFLGALESLSIDFQDSGQFFSFNVLQVFLKSPSIRKFHLYLKPEGEAKSKEASTQTIRDLVLKILDKNRPHLLKFELNIFDPNLQLYYQNSHYTMVELFSFPKLSTLKIQIFFTIKSQKDQAQNFLQALEKNTGICYLEIYFSNSYQLDEFVSEKSRLKVFIKPLFRLLLARDNLIQFSIRPVLAYPFLLVDKKPFRPQVLLSSKLRAKKSILTLIHQMKKSQLRELWRREVLFEILQFFIDKQDSDTYTQQIIQKTQIISRD